MGQSNYVGILEQCYAETPDVERWMEDLLDACRPILEYGYGYGFSLQRHGETGPVALLMGHRSMSVDPSQTPAAGVLDTDAYEALWHPRQPATFISGIVSRLSPELKPLMIQYLQAARVGDMFGMLGHPANDTAFSLWTGVGARNDISSGARDALLRIRVHVEAALRLRMLGPSEAVAVLTPQGRIEHVRGAAYDRSAREHLVEHTRNLEGARKPCNRPDEERTLHAWQALVDGRWSVVERLDSDGKRYYLAFENAPHAVGYHRLTAIESSVVELSSKGQSGKHVAYALGITESAASRHLQDAATRLGFRDRATLLRYAAHVQRLGSPVEAVLPQLTAAEHAVLDMLQRGMSNREISEARGSSERTIANQVAALLRKTGAPNRRALLVKPALAR